MSINLYKKKTINNQPVLEELLSKSTDTVDNKPLVYDSTTDNVKSVDDLTVNSVTASCFHGPLDGTAKNATCFNEKTYAEACADILSGCAADSNKLNGKTYSEVCADILSGTAANATCFAGKTCTEWKDIIKTTCVDNAALATNATCFNGCTYSEACTNIRNGLATQTCVDAVQACANAVQNCADFIQSCVSAIESKIPAQASASNQLADKAFVNSSITTNTANFRGTYSCVACLPTTGNTNNDYAFVCSLNTTTGNYIYDRYKWVASDSCWVCEYELNTTGFTAEQLASINSGITSNLVAKITDVYDNTVTVCMNGECKGSFNLNQNTDVCIDLGSSICNATNATCFNGCTYAQAKTDIRNYTPSYATCTSCPIIHATTDTVATQHKIPFAKYTGSANDETPLNCDDCFYYATVSQRLNTKNLCVSCCAEIDSAHILCLQTYNTIDGKACEACCSNCAYSVFTSGSANTNKLLSSTCGWSTPSQTCIDYNLNSNTLSNVNIDISGCSFKSKTACFTGNVDIDCNVNIGGNLNVTGTLTGTVTNATCVARCTANSGSCYLALFNANTASNGTNLYVSNAKQISFCPASGCLSTCYVRGISGLIAGNPIGCTSSVLGQSGTNISSGLLNLYTANPSIGFHVNDSASTSQSLTACCGRLIVTVNNRTGCTDSTETANFCFCSNGILKATCFDGNATCFGGCTYAQACTNIRSGLISDIGVKVYCGTTCKCTLAKDSSLCLSANAFNANATISTTTYPGACCTGTSNYVVTTMVCCANQVCRKASTITTYHLALFSSCTALSNADLYASCICPITYTTSNGTLKTCCVAASDRVKIGDSSSCTSTQVGKNGINISNGIMEFYRDVPSLDFHSYNYVYATHRFEARPGHFWIYVDNGTGCTGCTQYAIFCLCSNGTLTATCFCGTASNTTCFGGCTYAEAKADIRNYTPALATNATCFNGCTYAQACTDIRSGLISDIGVKVYCGTTCKCTLCKASSLCLSANAFNANATISTTTYPGACCTGTSNYVVTTMVCCAKTVCRAQATTGTCHIALFAGNTVSANAGILVSSVCPLTYNPATGVLTAKCFCGCVTASGQIDCAKAIKRYQATTGTCHIALFNGTTAIDNACTYVSSSCPLTYNPATGVLTTKCFCGDLSGTSTTSDFTCINCYTDNSDYDMAIVFGGSQPLGNVGVAEGPNRLTFNPGTGVLCAGEICSEFVCTVDLFAYGTARLGSQCDICIYDACGNGFICGWRNNLTIGYNSADFINDVNNYCRVTIGLDNHMCTGTSCGNSVVVGFHNCVCWIDDDYLSLIYGYCNSNRDGGIAIGGWNISCGECSVALGWDSCATDCGIAIGYEAHANSSPSIAIGCDVCADTEAIAIGQTTSAIGSCAIAIGSFAHTCAANRLAIGYGALAATYGTACVNSNIRKGALREITVTWCDNTLKCDIWKAIACNIDLRKNGKGTVLTSGYTCLSVSGTIGDNCISTRVYNTNYNSSLGNMCSILFEDISGNNILTVNATCTSWASDEEGGGFITITGWAR